jgi:hypothetical protein
MSTPSHTRVCLIIIIGVLILKNALFKNIGNTQPLSAEWRAISPARPQVNSTDSDDSSVSIKLNIFHFQYIARYIQESVASTIAAILPEALLVYNHDESTIAIRICSQHVQNIDVNSVLENCADALRLTVKAFAKPEKVCFSRCVGSNTLNSDHKLRVLEDMLGVICCLPPKYEPEQLLSLKLLFPHTCHESSRVLLDHFLRGYVIVNEEWPTEQDPFEALKVKFVLINSKRVRAVMQRLGVVFSTITSYHGGVYCSLSGREESVTCGLSYLESIVCAVVAIPPQTPPLCMDYAYYVQSLLGGSCSSGTSNTTSNVSVFPISLYIRNRFICHSIIVLV